MLRLARLLSVARGSFWFGVLCLELGHKRGQSLHTLSWHGGVQRSAAPADGAVALELYESLRTCVLDKPGFQFLVGTDPERDVQAGPIPPLDGVGVVAT